MGSYLLLIGNPLSTDCLIYINILDMRYRVGSEKNNIKLYHTPVSLNECFLPSYLSGYVDGEGCFSVSVSKSRRHKFGWEVRPSFSVSQNKNRSEVLDLFVDYLNCGSIRPNVSDNTLKYEVRSLTDLTTKVIPHFMKYPIISGKRNSFYLFKKVCSLMQEKRHLTKDGLKEILYLAGKINYPSKRKYIFER